MGGASSVQVHIVNYSTRYSIVRVDAPLYVNAEASASFTLYTTTHFKVVNTNQFITLTLEEDKISISSRGHCLLKPSSQTYTITVDNDVPTCSVVFEDANTIADTSNWMSKRSIAHKTLPQLTIPGAHNCGASRAYQDFHAQHYLSRYAICQNLSVTEMAHFGIRFFDLRVCDGPDGIYLSHLILVSKLDLILSELAEFLRQHQTEVIILWLKTDSRCAFTSHKELQQMLTKNFGDMNIRDNSWRTNTLTTPARK
jgi:hypothetical protein